MVTRNDVIDPYDPYEKEWNDFHDKVADECSVLGLKPYEALLIWQLGKAVFKEARYLGAKFTKDKEQG